MKTKLTCEEVIILWLPTKVNKLINNSMMPQIYSFAWSKLGLSGEDNFSNGTYERKLRKIREEGHLLTEAGLELVEVDSDKKEIQWRVVKHEKQGGLRENAFSTPKRSQVHPTGFTQQAGEAGQLAKQTDLFK